MGEDEMRIPYYVPKRLNAIKHGRLLRTYDRLIEEGRYTNGDLAGKLAEKIRKRTGYQHAVPMGQATHAIFVLAKWYKTLEYKTIWTPAFTWPSTYVPFQWLGYTTKFVDVDPETWLPDYSNVRTKWNEMCVPVDTFGSVDPYGYAPWNDSAQSLGAEWGDRAPDRVVSLSGSKILTSAEGGILLTQDSELFEFAKREAYWFSRMNELEAALGLAHLDELPGIVERKRRLRAWYERNFNDMRFQRIPQSTNNYVIAAVLDEDLGLYDAKEYIDGFPLVELRRYYSPAVDESGTQIDSFPEALVNTRFVRDRIVAFPSWPDLRTKDLEEAFFG